MAFKLVYTSAPKGLKEGSFGFCTVGCSRGLSERTIAALEAFSGYRRLFVDAEHTALNPVAYSHVLLDDGETTLRVLSRIADAGLDYSNRNNKIASHLILGHSELREAGPAAFFTTPGLFDKHWEGAPQYFENPFILPKSTLNVCSCDEWKKITGDPGWAGVLASTVYTDRPVVLIVRPEHNVLALYQEALSLLSPAMRWQVTFSTYYTKTPPGIRCQWKATMQGSSEAQTTRVIPYVLVLDLTSPRMPSNPESFATSPQASNLIDAARGLASSQAILTNSNSAPSTFNAPQKYNNGVKGTGSEKDDAFSQTYTVEEKKVSPLLNKVTSAIKKIDYGRGLPTPLKNIFESSTDEQKRWRIVGVVLISVFALIALLVTGTHFAHFVGEKATQNVQENVPQNEQASKDVAPDAQNEDAGNKISDDEIDKTGVQDDLDVFSVPQNESPNDPFAFEEENAKESKDQKDKKELSSVEPSFDSTESTTNSKSSEKAKEEAVVLTEKKEVERDGTDLSDLFSGSSFTSVRRPKFLTQEEYQTTVDFKDSVAQREFTVNFGVFQRKGNQGEGTLNDELTEDSQELFTNVLNLCRQFNGKLAITCDLSADQNHERQWLDYKRRTNKQEFDFSSSKTSDSEKVFFKTADKDNVPNGSLSIEIDPTGKITFQTSDESTRNYFLRSCKLKWTLVLPDPKETENDFIVETQYEQLLKPCEFDLLKDKIVASIIELSDDRLLPLAVQNDLSYYDPVDNPKHSPALLVLLNRESAPAAFDVDSKMDDKKKSIIFVFKLKAEKVEAFKIRFTRNSQVVKTETVFDEETTLEKLEDYFTRQSYPLFPVNDSYVSPQDRLQRATHEIESALNRKFTFDFYLVSTTGKDQKDSSKYVFVGSVDLTPEELDQRTK